MMQIVKDHLPKTKHEKAAIIPSMVISICIYAGIALWRFGTLSALIQKGMFSLFCFLVFVVSFVVCFLAVSRLYCFFDKFNLGVIKPAKENKSDIWVNIENYYSRHPYLSVMALFMVAYLPYIVLAYPSVLWGDAPAQILQGYNLPNKTMGWLKMLDENVYLNQHHSVPHTLLIHVCLVVGKGLFDSYNPGLFIYSLIQFLFIVFCFAYSIYYLYSKGVSRKVILGVLVYCLISPRLHTHIFLLTKDIIYGGFLLLFSVSTFDITNCKNGGATRKQFFVLMISALGLFLFRNEGIIIDVVVLVVAFVFSSSAKKSILGVLVTCLIIQLSLSKIIYPAFSISPGSIREVLCIPLQQTSRYLNHYPDEVTLQEKETISEIVEFDHLQNDYEWDRADRAKETFNNDYTNEQLKNYFKVWWNMFLKHPMTYFDATLHQTYRYFFPISGRAYGATFEDGASLMQYTNDNSGIYHMDFHYPVAFTSARSIYEKGVEFFARYTPIAIFSYSATYLWGLVIMFFYCISRKKICSAIVLLASVMQYAACFAGPLDGTCFRYIYPMAITLPFVFLLEIFVEKKYIV